MAIALDRLTDDSAAAGAALARQVADLIPALVDALLDARAPGVHREVLALVERRLLARALARTGGNQLRAARLIGINRNTLHKRCRQLGLETGRARETADRSL